MSLKITKHFFKYLGLFLLGIFVGFFAFNTYVGYSLLKSISAPESTSDFNLQKTATLYTEFTGSLNQVDELISTIDNSKKVNICSIICDASAFVSSYESYDSSTLQKYYEQSPKNALKDPDFRLLIDKLHRYSRMLPNNTKAMIRELILQSTEVSTNASAVLLNSFKLQFGLLAELPSYFRQVRRALSEEETIDQVRDLRIQCLKKGKNKPLIENCTSLMKDYGTTSN